MALGLFRLKIGEDGGYFLVRLNRMRGAVLDNFLGMVARFGNIFRIF